MDRAGENRISVFCEDELRQSQDWISNKWNTVENRLDIANSLLSEIMLGIDSKEDEQVLSKTPITKERPRKETESSISPLDLVLDERLPSGDSSSDMEADIPDLSKDYQLTWGSFRKRGHRGDLTKVASASKKQHCEASSSSSEELEPSNGCQVFVLPQSLTVDHENCKIGGESLFNTQMPLSSLVMSQ